MKRIYAKTSDSLAFLALRIFLAATILPHGLQKLFGWFGGYGFESTMTYFTEKVGLPWIIGISIVLLESVGALALIFGLGARFVGLAYTILAVGIIFTEHIQHGFFMNWFGKQNGEGIEYFLLWIGMSTALAIGGGGKYSLDRWLTK